MSVDILFFSCDKSKQANWLFGVSIGEPADELHTVTKSSRPVKGLATDSAAWLRSIGRCEHALGKSVTF